MTRPTSSAGGSRTVVQMSAGRRNGRSEGAGVAAGSLCLDFVATETGGAGRSVDLLATPDQLGAWLRGPGLPLPAGGVTDEDVAAARALRDAIDRVARALVAGRAAEPADVRCINRFARHPTPVILLRSGGRSSAVVEEADCSAALSVIARDAVHLFARPDVARLRECGRDGCTTLFYDRSPSGRRRWCSMKGCGEVVASASYRRRRAGLVK